MFFFVKSLFRHYEIKNKITQLIFSVTFALSLTLFELIIFEIAGILDSSVSSNTSKKFWRWFCSLSLKSRFFFWRFSLVAILVMVVAVIPYNIAHSTISNIRIGKQSSLITASWLNYLLLFSVPTRYSTALTVILWLCYIYSFYKLGSPFPLLRHDKMLR
jgi:golgi pH regulator